MTSSGASIHKAEHDLYAVLSNARGKPVMDMDQALEVSAAISRLVNAYVAAIERKREVKNV